MKSTSINIIVIVVELACFYVTITIMENSTWGLWSWQTVSVWISLIVMGLVNYVHGLYKCDVVT
jgi:hypothetical protein